MREICLQGQGASAMSSHADRYADIAVRQLGCRVSDAGPSQLFARALRAGVRKPPRKEPAGRRAGGAVYGDLTGQQLGQGMRWPA